MEIRNKAAMVLFALGILMSGTAVNAAADAEPAAAAAVEAGKPAVDKAAEPAAAPLADTATPAVLPDQAPPALAAGKPAPQLEKLVMPAPPAALVAVAADKAAAAVEGLEGQPAAVVAPAGKPAAAEVEGLEAQVLKTLVLDPAAPAAAVHAAGSVVAPTTPNGATNPAAVVAAATPNSPRTWGQLLEDAKNKPEATLKVTGLTVGALFALYIGTTAVNYANAPVNKDGSKQSFGSFFRDQLTQPADLDVNTVVKIALGAAVVGGCGWAAYKHFSKVTVVPAPVAA